jgi:hypothetical protein
MKLYNKCLKSQKISAFLKKFSQKTSYTIFDKPFIPIQKLSKCVATDIGSIFKYSCSVLSIYSWIAHIVSCLILITMIVIYAFCSLLLILTNQHIMQKVHFLDDPKNCN